MSNELVTLLEENDFPIEIIPEDRNYWFFRTEGGLFYKEFFHGGFIALGWDEVIASELLALDRKDAYKSIQSVYPEEKKPGKIYNQVQRFYSQMRVGDVVMIPGVVANTIAFGVIASEFYVNTGAIGQNHCPYTKRRKVRWIREVNRRKMDPNLHRMIRPQNAISDAGEYAPYIDRSMYDFYSKGEKVSFVMGINTPDDLSLEDLYDFINVVFGSVEDAKEILGKEFTRRDVDFKIHLQSPGFIELFSDHADLALYLGSALIAIFGGKLAGFEMMGLLTWIDKNRQRKHELELKQGEYEHQKEMKLLEHDLKMKQLAAENAYLKERLQIEVPGERKIVLPDELNLNSGTEKK